MVPEIALEPTVHLGHTVRDTLQIPKPSFSQQVRKKRKGRGEGEKTRISAQHNGLHVVISRKTGLAVTVAWLSAWAYCHDCVVVGYICRTNLCKDMDLQRPNELLHCVPALPALPARPPTCIPSRLRLPCSVGWTIVLCFGGLLDHSTSYSGAL